MTQYKGYYIDGSTFKNKADVDAFRESENVRLYIIAVEAFAHNKTPAAAALVDEYAEKLVNNFGYTWEQVEEIEKQVYNKIA